MKKKKLILIGSSTGGPGHLEKILSSLDPGFSSTLIIAQHIDAVFLPSMIKRFNDLCALPVTEVHENEPISDSSVIFTYKRLTDLQYHHAKGIYIKQCTLNSHYLPSVDSLFGSAARLYPHFDILACLLTGIGDDGVEGMLSLKKTGAVCISESEESSIVYGMPKAAFERGASTKVLSLENIISEINNF